MPACDCSVDELIIAQLLLDGSDNTTAAIALGYAQSLALQTSRDQMTSVLNLVGAEIDQPLTADVRTLFNPRLRSAIFLVPGLIVIILALVAVMLTALTVAREYERGSMEQLFATPVGPAQPTEFVGQLTPAPLRQVSLDYIHTDVTTSFTARRILTRSETSALSDYAHSSLERFQILPFPELALVSSPAPSQDTPSDERTNGPALDELSQLRSDTRSKIISMQSMWGGAELPGNGSSSFCP